MFRSHNCDREHPRRALKRKTLVRFESDGNLFAVHGFSAKETSKSYQSFCSICNICPAIAWLVLLSDPVREHGRHIVRVELVQRWTSCDEMGAAHSRVRARFPIFAIGTLSVYSANPRFPSFLVVFPRRESEKTHTPAATVIISATVHRAVYRHALQRRGSELEVQ